MVIRAWASLLPPNRRPRCSAARSTSSTNPIENLQGQLQRLARNVKRWRGGQTALRWGATGIRLAERRFRKIKGYRDMPALIRAIDAAVRKTMMDNKQKIA